MNAGEYQGIRFEAGAQELVSDPLVVEEALQLNINGAPYTVTMRSPGNDEDLIRGLFYSEDIFDSRGKTLALHVAEKNAQDIPTIIELDIPENELGKGYLGSRNILSVSSCGICGKQELDDIAVQGEALADETLLDPGALNTMFEAMRASQDNFERTGGCHAAAAFDAEGNMLVLREDIGRHNAVDKVIGALIAAEQLKQAICLLVSGRISYEIVSKTFRAKLPYLAAVSAPSTLAVDFAKELGITLLAFCRNGRATAYANVSRLKRSEQALRDPANC